MLLLTRCKFDKIGSYSLVCLYKLHVCQVNSWISSDFVFKPNHGVYKDIRLQMDCFEDDDVGPIKF